MKRFKHTTMMILLIIAALIGGYGFATFMVAHIWLALLMIFCIVCAFAVGKEV